MTEFNLIPYREILRKRHKRKWIFVFATVLLMNLLILAVIYHAVGTKLKQEQYLTQQLQDKLALWSQKASEVMMLKQELTHIQNNLNFLTSVRQQQNHLNKVFVELNAKTPETIFFSAIEMKNNTWVLTGYGKNSLVIGEFVKEIKTEKIFNKVTLKEIEHQNYGNGYQEKFILLAV